MLERVATCIGSTFMHLCCYIRRELSVDQADQKQARTVAERGNVDDIRHRILHTGNKLRTAGLRGDDENDVVRCQCDVTDQLAQRIDYELDAY